jgi:hypothetical protein
MSIRRAAPSYALAALALLACGALAGCDFIPKKVSKDDCKAWSKHTSEVTKTEVAKALKKCDDDTADAVKTSIDEALDEGQKEAVDSCSKQAEAGARVIPTEADCFMKGSSLADWKACNFTMDTFKTDGLDSALSKVESLCKGKKGDGGSKKEKKPKAKPKDDDE